MNQPKVTRVVLTMLVDEAYLVADILLHAQRNEPFTVSRDNRPYLNWAQERLAGLCKAALNASMSGDTHSPLHVIEDGVVSQIVAPPLRTCRHCGAVREDYRRTCGRAACEQAERAEGRQA